jgi:hypothetical protein
MKTKGFIVVASKTNFYYISALNLIDSIKDYYPEAQVTLCVEERLMDSGAYIADNIIHCDDHKRAKLYGMAQSPYDHTFYIDADCEVMHEDISTVFDLFDNNDVLFTALPKERSYCYAELNWPAGHFTYCGAVCLYDMSNPLVKEFMMDWYDLTVNQYAGNWWPTKEGTQEWDIDNYPRSLSRWDQFSLWWLINKEPKYENLNFGRLDKEEDARWNRFSLYRENHSIKDPVIWHHSAAKIKKEI